MHSWMAILSVKECYKVPTVLLKSMDSTSKILQKILTFLIIFID